MSVRMCGELVKSQRKESREECRGKPTSEQVGWKEESKVRRQACPPPFYRPSTQSHRRTAQTTITCNGEQHNNRQALWWFGRKDNEPLTCHTPEMEIGHVANNWSEKRLKKYNDVGFEVRTTTTDLCRQLWAYLVQALVSRPPMFAKISALELRNTRCFWTLFNLLNLTGSLAQPTMRDDDGTICIVSLQSLDGTRSEFQNVTRIHA